jgi:hypothetical protein
MNERQYLERQAGLVCDRLRRSSGALHAELEGLVGSTVGEHPHLALALGAGVGLALGGLVARGRAPRGGARWGLGGGGLALAGKVALFLVERLRTRGPAPGAASPSAPPEG